MQLINVNSNQVNIRFNSQNKEKEEKIQKSRTIDKEKPLYILQIQKPIENFTEHDMN